MSQVFSKRPLRAASGHARGMFIAFALAVSIGPAFALERITLAPTGIGHANDLMGQAVALDGATALVGAPQAAPVPYVHSGTAEVFRMNGGVWESEAVLRPASATNAMKFGSAVSLEGGLAVVASAPDGGNGSVFTFERDGSQWSQVDQMSFAGSFVRPSLSGETLALASYSAAGIYVRSGSGWAQQAELTGDVTPSGGEYFVDIALDGDLAVVLTQIADSQFSVGQYAYFFARTGATWTREAKIDLGTLSLWSPGGSAVAALSGQTALIGASQDDGAGLVRAFVRDQGTWSEQGTLDAGANLSMPLSLALEGDQAVVGCPADTVLGHLGAGTAYVFVRSASVWSRQAHIYDPAVNDFFYAFGTSVALSGGAAVIGSPGANTEAGQAGKALVFVQDADSWDLEANLDEGDARAGEAFGSGVAVSGTTLLVGAQNAQRENLFSTGAAHILERSGSQWVPSATLEPTSGRTQGFGSAVALDGDTAAIGAARDELFGAVYVYVRDGSSWPLQARLIGNSTESSLSFGGSVALEGDLLAVGEPNGANPSSDFAGQGYIFERAGSSWSLTTMIQPAESAAGDEFGMSMAISAGTLVVGAPAADIGIEAQAGAAYVFTRAGGVWSEQARLLAPVPATGAHFGASVAIAGDTAIVGAQSADRGAAYVFVREGGAWSWRATLIPPLPLPIPPSFGRAVALSSDQSLALIGMPDGTPDQSQNGSVFAFVRSGADWSPASTLHGSPPATPYPQSDYFGISVALSGTDAVIGAPGDGEGGAAYAASLGDDIFASGFEPVP